MFNSTPNRQFSYQEAGGQDADPVASRRHSTFVRRRPVDASLTQPQSPQFQHQHQRHFSIPGPESREHSRQLMEQPSFPPTPSRTPTTLSNSSRHHPDASPVVASMASPIQAPSHHLGARLDSVAARSNIAKITIEPELQQPSRPTFSTPDTITAVRENLMAIRRAQPDYKPPSGNSTGFLRKKAPKTLPKDEAQNTHFKFKELSYALDQEILQAETGSSDDVEVAANVEALLNLGADVNIYKHAKDSLVSKMHIGKSDANIEVAAKYIQNATERGMANVVWVLASRGVNQTSLNDAYHIAMTKGDKEVVRILLEHGADPNAFPDDFEKAVLAGRTDIAGLVMRSGTHVAQETLSKLLKPVVDMAYVNMVDLLVAHGADLEHHSAETLLKTVEVGRWDILLRMILNKTVPARDISQQYLSRALETAISRHHDPALRLIIVETLLCAGANGPEVSSLLMRATRECDTNLIELLLDFDVDVNYERAQPLQHAVSTGQSQLVELLLSRPPTPENVSLAFADIPFASHSEDEIRFLASLLLGAGASGENLAKLLVQAVRAGYNDLLQLLIDHNASIEYNDSEALVHAITSVDVRKTKALLRTSINPKYATIAFSAIDLGLEETVLHELMGLLLSRGACGDPVDGSLFTAVKKKQWSIITLLLSHNAGVQYGNAASLVHAINQSDEAMLDILLQNPVAPEIASTAFGALTMESKELYPIAQRLIKAGANGNVLSKLLIDAVQRQNFTIASLLLGSGASVTYEDGASLKKAVATGDSELVKMLLVKCTGGHGKETMRSSFRLAYKLKDEARIAIFALFIQYGLRGEVITESLIAELKQPSVNYEIVEMLARKGAADLAAYDGDALRVAVGKGDLKLLELLLATSPDTDIVSNAIPYAMDVRNDSVRFNIVEKLLGAGAQGEEVSIALLKTVRKQPEALGQIDLLLDHGADVNFNQGEIFRAAFTSKQIHVLKKLANYGANESSLTSVFQMAWEHNNSDWQCKAMEVVLQCGLRGPIVDAALVSLAQQEGQGTKVFSLLIKYGASVNHASGSAILECVRHGFSERLKLLLQQNPERSVIRDAFKEAMEHDDMGSKREMVSIILQSEPDQEDINEALIRALEDQPPSRRLVAILLDADASILHEDGKAIKLASMGGHHQALEMLFTKSPKFASELSMTLTTTFEDAMSSGVWKTEEGLLTVQVLLAHGASGIAIDKAFVTAAESYELFPTAKPLVESLLKSPNANVNREDGLCLQIAAQKGNAELVKLLLKGSPSKRSLSIAFPHVISSGTDETNLIRLAQLFLADNLETDLTFQHPSFGPVLFGALTKYPNFLDFYKLLVEGGASLESDVKINFHSVGERVTPLLWAILQLPDVIDSRIIKFFIDSGANVNFKSEYSGTTPLMVAVQRKRKVVVVELLNAGASVTIVDRQGQTALLKACQEGVYEIVELLLAKNKSRNDGSLHAAAAFCHAEIIGLLIREGRHDPDFPSSQHQGRSALAELAYVGDAIADGDRLKMTIETLIDNGADQSLRTDNKSPLTFGLDNKNPVEMTKLLLNSGLYKGINSNFNLYRDEMNTVYSPTMYVMKGLGQNRSPESQDALYQLLKSFRAEDRYYIDDPRIPQPMGYSGIPDYLAKIEEERQVLKRQIEHEKMLQQARIRMEKEEARERERIRNKEYQDELVRQADRKAREEARIAKQRAEEIAYMRSVNEQKQIAQDLELSRQLAHSQRIQQDEQEHKAILHKEELKMTEFKLAADRKRQQEIEDASNREHGRQLEYLKQWKGNLEAQKQLTERGGLGPSQRQLMWPYTKDDIPD